MMSKEEYPLDVLTERFWEEVEKTETCWVWKRYNASNRSRFHLGGGFSVQGQYFAWQLAHGKRPDARRLKRLCDNPACVKPEHYCTKEVKPKRKPRKPRIPIGEGVVADASVSTLGGDGQGEAHLTSQLFSLLKASRESTLESHGAHRRLLGSIAAQSAQITSLQHNVDELRDRIELVLTTLEGVPPKLVVAALKAMRDEIRALQRPAAAAEPPAEEPAPAPVRETVPTGDHTLESLLRTAFRQSVKGSAGWYEGDDQLIDRVFTMALEACDGDNAMAVKTFEMWLGWYGSLTKSNGGTHYPATPAGLHAAVVSGEPPMPLFPSKAACPAADDTLDS